MRQLLLLALLTSVVKAQDLYPRLNQNIPRVQFPVSSGLLTDRISKKQLKRWQEIERFIFVKDAKGQPLYRMLVSLWNWVETSGHAVHIEVVHQVDILSSLERARYPAFDPPKPAQHIESKRKPFADMNPYAVELPLLRRSFGEQPSVRV
jgi:hypothetical protein